MSLYTIDFERMLDELASRLECDRPDDYFTETILKRYINLGIIEMAKRTKLVHTVKFLYLSAGIHRYTCPTEWLYGQQRQVLYLKTGSLSGYQYPLKKIDRRGMQAVINQSQNNFLSAGNYGSPSTGFPESFLLDGDVIEFDKLPSSEAAGSNRICFKFPGMPDQLSATSAVPNIPLEYRMIPVTYGEHLGQLRSKDMRANDTLRRFYAECEEAEVNAAWNSVDEPPSMLPEEYFRSSYWGTI